MVPMLIFTFAAALIVAIMILVAIVVAASLIYALAVGIDRALADLAHRPRRSRAKSSEPTHRHDDSQDGSPRARCYYY